VVSTSHLVDGEMLLIDVEQLAEAVLQLVQQNGAMVPKRVDRVRMRKVRNGVDSF